MRVSTEYPGLTRRFFEKKGIDADIRLSYGATEAKVPEIADCIVDLTETGRALKAAGLKIIDSILDVPHRADREPASRTTIPRSVMRWDSCRRCSLARSRPAGQVLVKLNVSDAAFERVIALVPSMKSPTISKLFGNEGGYAVETVVPKATINVLIPTLKDAGATDLIELPISKIVH